MLGAALILFLLISVKYLFMGEIYNWQLSDPFFTRSLAASICVIFVSQLIAYKFQRGFFGALVVLCIFLSWQAVIVPYVTVLLYFEGIVFIGSTLRSRTETKEKYEPDLILDLITGMSCWGAAAIVSSLLGFGTIVHLRIMTVGILILCAIINREQRKLGNTILGNVNRLYQQNKGDWKWMLALNLLLVLGCMLAARTNNSVDFDSVWYLLKPEHFLIGEHSFYDYLGYSGYVYYYPKLFELFMLPVSGLGDYSFIQIGNVFFYYFLSIAITQGMSRRSGHKRLLPCLAIMSVPVVTALGVSAKPDMMGAFLTVTTVVLFLRFIESHDRKFVFYSLVCLALSTGTKVTFLAWGGLVFLCILVYFIFRIKENRKADSGEKKYKGEIPWVLITALILIAGIHYRTLLLTGYPVYPVGIGIWDKLGFTPTDVSRGFSANSNYFGAGIDLPAVMKQLVHFIFNPDLDSLLFTKICWPTNLWLVCYIAMICLAVKRRKIIGGAHKWLVLLSTAMFVFTLLFAGILKQPDGNYFIVPAAVILFACFKLYYWKDREEGDGERIIMESALGGWIVFGVIFLLVTNWSGSIGYQYYDAKLIRNNFDTDAWRYESMSARGYENIAAYIEEYYPDMRIIISRAEMFVDGSVETANSAFSPSWSSTEKTDTYEGFVEYIKHAEIRGFVILDDDTSVFSEYVERLGEEVGFEETMKDRGAVFYIVDEGMYG